jgi:DNA segregation ATPase FtsK/SpoIIIE, S-DNA-T family
VVNVAPADVIERRIQDAYARLAESVAVVRYCHEHYLDDLADDGTGRSDDNPLAAVTELAAGHPWALGGFGDPGWEDYQPDQGAAPPDGLRVGALTFGQGNGLPPMPAVARLAGHGHILIMEDGAPQQARSLLQALALRLAVATRPGSVRFALADPVGQGQHLSAFLRLPTPLLRLGSGVAASEPEVEGLLKTLTEHVVEVTQHRLTNVYSSIEEYNAATTGAAVPYTVLVLAGFPAHFTDRTAKLLATLAENGPRAGVYIIATVDPGQEMPRDFVLESLTGRATNLRMTSAATMSWDDLEFPDSMIEPDQMPSAARVNPWLDAIAAAAQSVSLDLPFERIAVPAELRWLGESTDGLWVQVGTDSRGEPQYFAMGSGAVHHGLVGGDVRMGKTNLLHVLISQLALRYPPEELEFYLLDFKEVEFDAYLTERLPHGRAITSRTDREFGLSMLRKFHEEIDRRARLCRESGTTNLPEYRQETGRVLPRALVIMDEFQVMFADEDRIAREAARLLADIAKRGATFGLHLLLATQSPGGSFAAQLRPVYEQMALRIALGCTMPSVSQAILGEGNEAATKLTRAGDAIYNDRRGEGPNPVIRIAALPTRDRRQWITTIRALAGGREYPPPETFDPDAPADFSSHPAAAVFAARPGQWPNPKPVLEAWLGEAVEIKPPTTAAFERYIHANLLIVGEEDNGRGLLLATLLSAALQRSPADVIFTIAEFARPSSPFHRFFAPLRRLPHEIQVLDPRSAQAGLNTLIADLDQQLADPDGPPGPERFLLVAGLHRWQEALTEVNYGPSEVAKKLTRLAEEGPDVGIHLAVWADSYASAERAFRRNVSQFGLRAVLRVSSTTESDYLLGVPAAASLEDNRALYRDTEWPHEQVEKFKPYSLASLQAFAQTAFRSLHA